MRLIVEYDRRVDRRIPQFCIRSNTTNEKKKKLGDVYLSPCEVIVREDDSKVTREIVFTRDAALVDARRRGCCVKKAANPLAYQHI